jgi:hypothetical protein
MWRPAIGRTPTLVEGQTNGTTPKANELPWTRPWWQPSEGNCATLFYIVMIHALALVGLVLFPPTRLERARRGPGGRCNRWGRDLGLISPLPGSPLIAIEPGG